MLKCAYIILMYNNEDNIYKLVASLKNLQGNFRKEFIFVDDGSSDKTLEELKKAVIGLPRTTIITQEHQGSSLCVNKALSIAHADYVQFVDGNEIVSPYSTVALLDSCAECNAEVALGMVSHDQVPTGGIEGRYSAIADPFREILEKNTGRATTVGGAGSLVSKGLLEKVNYADSTIYSHQMSLSLRCSEYTCFAVLDAVVSYVPKSQVISERRLDAYNNIKAIFNFIKSNKEIASRNLTPLLLALSSNVLEKRAKLKYFLLAKISKYFDAISYKKLLSFFKLEYEKLF